MKFALSSETWTRSALSRRLVAAAIFVALTGAILVANAVRVAESSALVSKRIGWGPAELGRIRGQLGEMQANRFDIDGLSARRALASSPLANEPFAAIAAASLIKDPRGTTGREAALLAEALRRDPRSRAARILLMRQMAARGDLNGAMAQLDKLFRLNPVLVTQAMDSIARLVGTPQQMDTALTALSGRSNLYEPFVDGLVGKNKPREVLVRLAQGLPPAILARPGVRRSIVGQLVDVQEISLAKSIWQAGNGKVSKGLVFSPDFSDRQTPPPFNWQLFQSASGAADFGKVRGLGVSYYDRSPGRLVRQVVSLPPGRYRLRVDFRKISGSANNMRLRVTCYGAAVALVEIPLFANDSTLRKAEAGFEVPQQACDGQDLAVWGVISEQRSETEVELLRVDILPGGDI